MKYKKSQKMPIKVYFDNSCGPIIASGKNMPVILSALGSVSAHVSVTELSKKTGIPIATVWDCMYRICKDNDVSVIMSIKSRGIKNENGRRAKRAK